MVTPGLNAPRQPSTHRGDVVIIRLSIACGLIAITVAIQALFMSAGLHALRRIDERRKFFAYRHPTVVTVAWVIYLIFPIIIDVCLWAAFYYVAEALPSFEEAFYFSTVTFTTVGYGDIVLGRDWRQIATFEAVNGWIIFGWATALMMAVIQRLYFREPEPGRHRD
ncbi:potassium channel family protein [Sinorhizobium terangae]|uniref:potassium channel family protein n=1 Tax=Sinorhizobium terangae TaxID=110322 RepID=UPI0024B268FD|nr:potassium channel family protein [Sinorhizobium terangae]WFU51629.1 potassium channel family protein [Sinorhizobium terangae]